ncbi:MAG TPA: ABC transporter ATP-binding protein [Spirochaetota bacterium]|nr:ABC transporter ATP-binding protein [Spirochaetota bacterium]
MFTIFKTFSPLLKRYRSYIIAAVLFMIGMDLVSYILPLYIKYITDHIFPFIKKPGMLRELYTAGALILAAAFFRGAMAHFMIRCYWYSAEAIVRDLRNKLYDKLQHMPASFYSKARTGDLMSRVSTDIQRIRNFFAFGVEHRLRIIFICFTVLALMLWQNWRLALLVYLFIPLVYIIIIYFSRKLNKAVMAKHRQAGRLTAVLQENLSGIRIVKAFAAEKQEQEKFDRENVNLRSKDIRVTTLQAHLNPVLRLTSGIGALVILVYGGYQVINGTMSLGVLMGFLTYLMIIRFPLFILAFNTTLLSLARGAAVRINEILLLKDQREDDTGTRKQPLRGKLEFRNVCFQYDQEHMILRNLSFTINPGERVAVFGVTGSGKSSLISLIPRFYHPCGGEIRLDGYSLNEWDLAFLRSNISTVLQENFLFSTTIRENIAFGRPGASMAAIRQAAAAARIDDFINSLPEGYETIVGEYGAGLSGGQRQRIAIARALLRDPRLLILDDCTSSLDPVTERKIQQELGTLMQNRTTVIIAQRISTLRLADRIIVLDQGTVQDFASHEKLLRKNSLYRETWQTQTEYPANICETP